MNSKPYYYCRNCNILVNVTLVNIKHFKCDECDDSRLISSFNTKCVECLMADEDNNFLFD